MNKQKLDLDLEGLDGNAFALLAHANKIAKRVGWNKEQIDELMDEAQSGDYDHLLQTLMNA